jgi:hypothetical protein
LSSGWAARRAPTTVNGSNRGWPVGAAVALALGAGAALAQEPALTLRAAVISAASTDAGLTIDLFRWSTDAERAPLLAALSDPPPAPPAAPGPAAGAAAGGPAGAAGRGGRAGRGGAAGRGGRGGAPASPIARLTAAVRAAPTLGFVWGDGVTGYSIKYAWRGTATDGGPDRIVLLTDRRLGAHATDWAPAPAAAPDAEFTLIELRVDAKGAGEGKTSLTSPVVVDAAARTLALDGYQAAPALLKVTR